MFGQELNPESYAICKADMLIKGQPIENIVQGNTLSEDGHPSLTFDYMLSNPPFGVEWKKVEKQVRAEHEQKGYAGRFGPGLRINDPAIVMDGSDMMAEVMLTILGMVGMMEKHFIKARQKRGIEAAKLKNVYKGRPATISPDAVRQLHREGLGATEIAKRLKIGRASVYRALAA